MLLHFRVLWTWVRTMEFSHSHFVHCVRMAALWPSILHRSHLRFSKRISTLNSFSQAQARKIACGATSGEVRMKPNWHHLQAIRKEENIVPELLKIDVAGFELPVLQGGERVLQSAKLLFLEVHPQAIDELRLSRPAIFDLLTGSGWSWYTLKDGRLTREDFAAQTDIFWTMWRKC